MRTIFLLSEYKKYNPVPLTTDFTRHIIDFNVSGLFQNRNARVILREIRFHQVYTNTGGEEQDQGDVIYFVSPDSYLLSSLHDLPHIINITSDTLINTNMYRNYGVTINAERKIYFDAALDMQGSDFANTDDGLDYLAKERRKKINQDCVSLLCNYNVNTLQMDNNRQYNGYISCIIATQMELTRKNQNHNDANLILSLAMYDFNARPVSTTPQIQLVIDILEEND